MSGPESDTGDVSRITHGAVTVLAYLHEREATCRQVATAIDLAESSCYRWLTELEEVGILEAEATRPEDGRAVVEYQLPDDELGAAAQVVAERLGTTESPD